jgi:hypothetical protein
VQPVTDGCDSEFAAILTVPFGQFAFCRGVRVGGAAARIARVESRIGRVLPGCAARVRWQVEVAGWLVLGFDHIDGRPANLSPGSRDFLLVVGALVDCARELTPSPVQAVPVLGEVMGRVEPWRALRDQPSELLGSWARSKAAAFAAQEPAALEMVSGRTLAHADIREQTLLVGAHTDVQAQVSALRVRAHVVGWACATLAAPWVDMSHLVIRLIAAGHTPAQAEDWVRHTAVWRNAPRKEVTALAIQLYGWWEYLHLTEAQPVRDAPIAAARTWAMYRTAGL